VSEQAGRYQRSFNGMVGAMVILLLVIGGFVVVRALNRDDPPDPVQSVDYAQAVKYYKTEADFTLVAPRSLPAGWRATSQRFTDTRPQSWHLGCLTDGDHYVGLEQAKLSTSAIVEQYVDADAVQGKDVTIDGTSWQSWSDAGGDHGLVRRTGPYATLVVGSAPEDDLEAFVRLLR
jgi:Protein of unknown function (DUF4245)